MRTMAQRLAPPASVPQTHAEQAQQDEKDSAQLFFNSLGRLADGDADLSKEEANILRRWGTQGPGGCSPVHALHVGGGYGIGP